MSVHATADEMIRRRQRVDESAAHSLHVKSRRAIGNAEFVLNDAGGARKHHVGRGRGENDQVDVVGHEAGRLDGALSGDQGQIAARHIGVSVVTRMDAAARHDPFVAGFDAVGRQTGGQLCVGLAIGRQVTARPGDTGINTRHKLAIGDAVVSAGKAGLVWQLAIAAAG